MKPTTPVKKEKNKSIEIKPSNQEWDSTFQLMSWWKKDTVKKAKVMVVGAGALGNEVIKNLILLNVGNILIVDFDIVEFPNLNRSVLFRSSDCGAKKGEAIVRRAKEINPDTKIQFIDGDITTDVGLGIFRRVDVIIGCLDNRLARLFLNQACYKVGKIWIDAAIENLAGQVKVYKPYKSCYECGLSEKDWKHIKFKLGCLDIAKRNVSQGRIPTTPISSSIMAAIQVQEALKVIHQNNENLMDDQSLYYEGMNNIIMQLKNKPLKEECGSHFTYEQILSSPIRSTWSVADTLEWLAQELKEEIPVIDFDHQVVLKITSKQSEQSKNVVIPYFRLGPKEFASLQKIPGEEIVFSDSIYKIDKKSALQNYTLQALGIPPLHILKVWANEKEHYIELSGDEDFLI